jgi:hypothetical protein
VNLIQLARKHIGNGAAMESSSRLCLADSIRHSDAGNYHQSGMHAVRSLAYSVGICHPDYRKAWAFIRGTEEPKVPSAMEFIEAIESDENESI